MKTIFDLIIHVTVFIDRYLVPLIFAIAFLVFIWGVYKYFIQGGAADEEREKGKQLIFWGLIGFAIMISVWGLVNLVVASSGINPNSKPNIPTSGAYEQVEKAGGKGGGTVNPPGAPLGGPNSVGGSVTYPNANPNSGLCTPDQPENC